MSWLISQADQTTEYHSLPTSRHRTVQIMFPSAKKSQVQMSIAAAAECNLSIPRTQRRCERRTCWFSERHKIPCCRSSSLYSLLPVGEVVSVCLPVEDKDGEDEIKEVKYEPQFLGRIPSR